MRPDYNPDVMKRKSDECREQFLGPAKTETAGAPGGSLKRLVSGITIPNRAPPGVVEALRNFVDAVFAYEETGVWPDNGTIRRLAEEGRDALQCGYAANVRTEREAERVKTKPED